ncbi:glycosyltransferase family 39 protein, partial [Patescibacteria group bacterium]|nr:glycosyltransferase family 39 protein [Patescibacteria group bacterium]
MKMLIKKENILLLVLSLAILVYLALPIFQPGLPANNDREVYLTWLTEFEQNIKDGNLIPRWAPDLWHGMGSPLFIFVSPGFYYLAELFRLGSLGILLSVKLAIYLSLLVGFVFMFLFAKKLWGKWPALLCATVYTFMPYHLGLIIPRGGYAELLAMALWPVNLYIFYQLIHQGKIKFWLIGTFTVFLQMLAHNILSVMFIPLLFFFILFFIRKSKHSKWLPLSSLLLGVLLASF